MQTQTHPGETQPTEYGPQPQEYGPQPQEYGRPHQPAKAIGDRQSRRARAIKAAAQARDYATRSDEFMEWRKTVYPLIRLSVFLLVLTVLTGLIGIEAHSDLLSGISAGAAVIAFPVLVLFLFRVSRHNR